MRQVLDQFRNLNTRDPGSWPPAPKIVMLLVLFVGILVAAYFFHFTEQLDELERGRQEELQLKQAYVDKKKQAINIEQYRQQLREIDSSFGALLKQLPNKQQMEALLVDVNQAGLGRGLQFELFRPGPEAQKDFYAEQPVTIKVVGTYHDMGAFTSDVAQLSRIVTLNDIALSVAKDGNLVMDGTAKAFRYLDEEEIAAQRRAAKAAKAGKR